MSNLLYANFSRMVKNKLFLIGIGLSFLQVAFYAISSIDSWQAMVLMLS